MAQTHPPADSAPEPESPRAAATRREALHAGARAIAGLTVGSQVLAATGAPTALARQVRALASARATSPATAASSFAPARCRCRPASPPSASAPPASR